MAKDGLSNSATQLWCVLKTCTEPVPDRILSEFANIPVRDIIDYADELLAAGIPVCADGRGRWIGDLDDLRRYHKSLDSRAKRVFQRRQHVQTAIETLERKQSNLFEASK